ncbi:MAG: ribosomal protein L7/L12 [Micrococcales bacterium]|nr:ribosomal protein L7/L12 [Micrococcales bacterium]
MGIFDRTQDEPDSYVGADTASARAYLSLEARVASLEAAVARLQGATAANVQDAPPWDTFDRESEARALAAAGRKIEAIKRVRDATGWGLKQVKDYVDAF